MQKKICGVYGEGAVDDSTCRKCHLSDASRSGRPAKVDGNEILVENFLESTS